MALHASTFRKSRKESATKNNFRVNTEQVKSNSFKLQKHPKALNMFLIIVREHQYCLLLQIHISQEKTIILQRTPKVVENQLLGLLDVRDMKVR